MNTLHKCHFLSSLMMACILAACSASQVIQSTTSFASATITPSGIITEPSLPPTSTSTNSVSTSITIQPFKTLKLANAVYDVEWSPDGSKLASTDGPVLSVWNTNTWQPVYIIPDADAISVTWSPDSKFIATTKGGTQEHLDIWDGSTGKLLNEFKRPPYGDGAYAWISQSAWSPDGKFIATNASNGGILIWNAATGDVHLVNQSSYQDTVQISWSPDSKRLANSKAIWNISNDKIVLEIQSGNWLSWNPSQDKLAVSGIDPSTIRIIDTTTGTILKQLDSPDGNTLSISWSSDGNYLATVSSNVVLIWDPVTDAPIASLEGHTMTVNSVTWNPMTRTVASGGSDNTIRIWDLGDLLPELPIQ